MAIYNKIIISLSLIIHFIWTINFILIKKIYINTNKMWNKTFFMYLYKIKNNNYKK